MDANLDSLPVEALQALMASLSFQDAKRLCSSTKKMEQICKRNNLLDLKAREYVNQHAPGTVPVTSFRKYADLIAKGFETVYRANPDIADQTAELGLGGISDARFSVKGFPRPEGSDGYIFGSFAEDRDGDQIVENCEFFATKDDLLDSLNEATLYPMGFFAQDTLEIYRNEDGGNAPADEVIEDALDQLLEEAGNERYFAVHVFF